MLLDAWNDYWTVNAVSNSRVVVTVNQNVKLYAIRISQQKQENKNAGMTCQEVYKQGRK